MKLRFLSKTLAIAGTLVVLASIAWATCTGVMTASPSGATSGNVTFSLTLSDVPNGQLCKDIHITHAAGGTFPSATTPVGGGGSTNIKVSSGGTDQTWNYKGTPTSITLYTNGDAGEGFDGSSTITFTLQFPQTNPQCQSRPIEWKATYDGSTGVGSLLCTSNGTSCPNAPQLTISINDDDAMSVYRNATTPIPATSAPLTGGSVAYQIYTSLSLSSYADPLGIGINSVSDPVPSSWNLTFSNLTGTLDQYGEPSSLPTVYVPNNPSLLGLSFYAVFAVKDGSGAIVGVSVPVEMTISNP